MRNHRLHLLLATAAACSALAGCFGGGDDTPAAADPLTAVPTTATDTPAGTVDYQVLLAANTSETREAIDLSGVTLPTSETAEPIALN